MTFHISINDNSSEIWREYPEGIKFDVPYEVGLKSFVTYNSIRNVTERNNKVVYLYLPDRESKSKEVELNTTMTKGTDQIEVVSLEQQKPRTTRTGRAAPASPSVPEQVNMIENEFTYDIDMDEETEEMEEGVEKKVKKKSRKVRKYHFIEPGIYEVEELLEEIQTNVPTNRNISLTLNKRTLRVDMKGDVGIDFSGPISIGPVLGFERTLYKANINHTSTRMVDIFPINMIRIRCNLVKSNVSDTKLNDDTIFEFPLNVARGEKIIERPNTTTFYKVNTDILHELHLKIVDQDNHLVDFRGERISIVLEFKNQYEQYERTYSS